MDAGELVRFKVTSEMFSETCPSNQGPATSKSESKENSENKVPYLITVCLE